MIIVMTGATSGIGAEALKHFVELPDTKVYAGVRGSGRIVPEGTAILPLDLSSLKSVSSFADNIKQRLGNTKIDILVLNAGIQATDNKQRSEEGFELTFATNHLAHYLLARLLLPNLAKGGKIVITTSDSHDPEIIFFGPKTLDLEELAYPDENSPKGMRFYATTKLCNLLTARSLSAISLKDDSGISVIAYNPGLTGDTSLMGKQSAFIKILLPVFIRPLFYVVSMFKPAFFMGTAKRSGEALAELALGKVTLPTDKIYASLVRGKLTFPNPSQLAQDNNTRDLLWKESAKMAGLPE
ncbi:SDR family NAD(P)-dependent oxidoreductase [Chitinophaga sp. XS-30]|uniref:SDR family NAD(P)-dependent oxidoreductase n=1 Tax=Chitinophaga sp. XS-30 TaxID=2604421 RepID=UPI0011DCABEC|nr:SDR family NAD(P)-dependent oxidoreductase [Chitinophaga sp. XS-30]QEH42428.1 SDR family NAD(P)-dependent oxidoreductase [Chitinophaga sp. XS-30]